MSRPVQPIATKGGIDGAAVVRTIMDRTKTWMREDFRSEPGKRLEKAGVLAKFSALLSRSLLGRLIDLEQRVEALDGIAISKSLDVEAYDSIVEMAERLEKLEAGMQEVADNGFRYRGYWRDGMTAKRGDAFTHDGSMWWTIRDTSEAPSKESLAWQVAVRKGRDAK